MFDALNRKLSIRLRFMLVSAIFLAATLFGAFLLFQSAQQDIAFSTKERSGVAALRPVWAAIRSNSAVDAAALGELVSSDKVGAFNNAADPADRMAAGLALIAGIADGSNLTLDPDLDSFYAMDALTVRLPAALASSRHLLDQIRAGGDPAEATLLIKVALTNLNDAASAAAGSLNSAMANNAAGMTRAALSEPADNLSKAAAALVAAVNAGQSLDQAAGHYDGAIERIWQADANELDRLLDARVAGLKSDLMFDMGLLALALGAALVLAWVVASGLNRRFKALTGVMDVLKTGEFKVEIPFLTDGHETGAISNTLKVLRDAMANRAVEDARRLEEAETGASGMIAAISRSQAMIEFTPEGKILSANENFCRVMGYSADEIVGKHHSMFVDPAFRSSPDYTAFWDALGKGTFKADKFKRIGKGGNEVWIQATYNPIADRTGKVVRVVKFASDITVEENLAVEAAYKSAAFSGSSVAMMLVDRDLKITFLNGASVSLFEANLAAFRSIWPDFDPKNMVGQCIDKFHRNPAHQRQLLADPSRLPYRTDISVGDLKIQLSVSAAYDNKNNYIGSMLEWDNVTTARLNSGKLDAVDRSQSVCELSLDGQILEVNDNFTKVYGHTAEAIRGKHHRILVAAAKRSDGDYKSFWEALAAGKYQAGKYARVNSDGQEVWIQASYNPILDGNGRAFKIVEFASDITAAEAERNAAEAEREVRSAEQEKVVGSLASGLKSLSTGDLTARLETAFAGEYEQLRVDFNHAAEQLQDAMKSVIVNAGGIRTGAGEITQAADDLSKRTEQQAASLEETAAALDEITATVRKSADSAKQANVAVATTKANAEASGVVVQKTVAAMAEIEKSSKQISQIIGVIDEIAFQTNLLALNAGVEAARAGDAGRGFAVVASEVRALAQRSSDAAKEIKDLISASSQQVESGVQLVGEAGRALSDIAERVTEISGLVSGIAASAQEQSTALAEVNTAVNQMDQVTQQNAAMVEQSTAASHSLNQETTELMSLVAKFKTGTDVVVEMPTSAPRRSEPRARTSNPSLEHQKRRVAQFAAGGGAAAADDADWQEF